MARIKYIQNLILYIVLIFELSGGINFLAKAQEFSQNKVKVIKHDIISEAFYHGEIDHLEKIVVTSQIPDEISTVNIKTGDQVMKDDILIQFDLKFLEHKIIQLDRQLAQLEHWKTNKYPAEKEVLKMQSIFLENESDFKESSKRSTVVALYKAYEEKIATKSEIKEAENNLSNTLSQIKLKRAEQKIKVALLEDQKINNEIVSNKLLKEKEDLLVLKEEYTIRAPFNGTIIAVNNKFTGNYGKQPDVNEFLFTIVNQNSKILKVTIPEPEIYKLINEKNNMCFVPRNNLKLDCKLISISLEKSMQGIEQYIASYEIINANEPLIVGETAEIHLKEILKQDALAIPVSLLVRKNNTTGVMILNNGERVFTPVSLGVSSHDYVEVLSGLQFDQEITLP